MKCFNRESKCAHDTYTKEEIDNKMIPNFMKISLGGNYTHNSETLGSIIPLTVIKNSCGDKLTLNENGTITIGEGVNNVRVYGSVHVTPSSEGYRNMSIDVNGDSVTLVGKKLTGLETIPLSPSIVNVKVGDVISLYHTAPNGDVIGGLDFGTFLVVEVIN